MASWRASKKVFSDGPKPAFFDFKPSEFCLNIGQISSELVFSVRRERANNIYINQSLIEFGRQLLSSDVSRPNSKTSEVNLTALHHLVHAGKHECRRGLTSLKMRKRTFAHRRFRMAQVARSGPRPCVRSLRCRQGLKGPIFHLDPPVFAGDHPRTPDFPPALPTSRAEFSPTRPVTCATSTT